MSVGVVWFPDFGHIVAGIFFCLQALRKQVQNFATALLDHTRSSCELEILLNHDPAGPAYQHGERMHLNRLKLAIKYRQKKVSPELVRDRFVTLLVPLVRSSPQCPATTRLYLVRGVARLQADEHDPAGSGGL